MDFKDLIQKKSHRFTKDDFVKNFGGIVDQVAEMLSSDIAKQTLEQAREMLETEGNEELPNGVKKLHTFDFGNFHHAPELNNGEVAAIDGTPVLPMQKFTAGQALCVGIGSLSYKRKMEDTLHGYTTNDELEELHGDIGEYLKTLEKGLYSISPTAYMRYYEAEHAKEVQEPYIFFDGPLIYEWLVNQEIGRELYQEILSQKVCIGVIKNLKDNVRFQWLSRALYSGELFIDGTLYDHFMRRTAPNRERTERGISIFSGLQDVEFAQVLQKIYRGIFKPRNKAFGFECHLDHLEEMLRIMSADCQMNHPGHEIPYLLNEIDRQVKRFFKSDIIKKRIAQRLSKDSEELFFGEGDEHDFR